jgi:hypothetical protein
MDVIACVFTILAVLSGCIFVCNPYYYYMYWAFDDDDVLDL